MGGVLQVLVAAGLLVPCSLEHFKSDAGGQPVFFCIWSQLPTNSEPKKRYILKPIWVKKMGLLRKLGQRYHGFTQRVVASTSGHGAGTIQRPSLAEVFLLNSEESFYSSNLLGR